MRLIDADELLKQIQTTYCRDCKDCNKDKDFFHCRIEQIIGDIHYAPTVEQWHYPSKGEYPTVTGSYLVFAEGENGLQYAIGEYFAEANRERWMRAGEWYLELDGVSGEIVPIAWMHLPQPPKEEK